VQHKQIRPRDLQDREESHGGGYGIATGGEGGSFGRNSGPFSSSLPPAGPVPNSQNLWYDPHAETSGEENPMTAVSAAVANSTEGNANNGSNIPEDSAVEFTGNESIPSSSLNNLGTLQSALPDVSGNTPE
jgi:hypothetical protein